MSVRGGRARILVVEDERIVAEDLRETLEDMGYSVAGIAGSGEQAIEMARQEVPDIVLMDIMLSGEIDGITAASQIQGTLDIPVIFVTAYSDQNLIERAKVTEPYGYIVKPFNERELRSCIEIALYRHRAEREIRKRDAILLALGFGVEWFLRQVCEVCGARLGGGVPTAGRTLGPYALEPFLEQVGVAMDLSRVVVFRHREEDGRIVPVAEWCSPGIPPLRGEREPVALALEPVCAGERLHALVSGECVTVTAGSHAEDGGEFSRALGIRSAALFSLTVRDRFYGIVAFCDAKDREFPGPEIEAMRIAAGILGGAIGLFAEREGGGQGNPAG
ncbi:MAG: response regulator [Methanolinea sp.]|nr:response regulator [Methanolinea sp.]